MLNKPFAVVSEEIGLGYAFTQRGIRRTFNDLCRAARVEDIVTRSISGYLTERMQHHYSTVRGDEQRVSIAKVIDLMTARKARASAEKGLQLGPPPRPNHLLLRKVTTPHRYPMERRAVLQMVLHPDRAVLSHRPDAPRASIQPGSQGQLPPPKP